MFGVIIVFIDIKFKSKHSKLQQREATGNKTNATSKKEFLARRKAGNEWLSTVFVGRRNEVLEQLQTEIPE
jgi:hypothetical protein